MFNPRPGQTDVIQYKHGEMGVTAVPGSGKTHTLSYLAAKLVASDLLAEDQEILIVTLVNSAVNNFSERISQFLREFGLIPGVGYRVRTLHGLAYDIVREQPQLAGLDNQFSIADERTSSDILNLSAVNWMRLNTDILLEYSPENMRPSDNKNRWGQLIQSIAGSYIKLAKDFRLTPETIQTKIDSSNNENNFLKMGNKIYSEYQRSLHDRAAVDFDDLIRLAYQILLENPDYLDRLQTRWPIILEDEAQDSSNIQEKMLSLLTSKNQNWVRVGDPNQAIFETFTTANPELLKAFMGKPDVISLNLPYSGRSTLSIIELANFLIRWVKDEHPVESLRRSLDEPFIIPTPPDDPQPNPVGTPQQIYFHEKALTPQKEIDVVARSAGKWIEEHPDKTLAILVPRNNRGAEMVEQLTKLNIPCIELLSTSKAARDAALVLRDILMFFGFPNVRRNLSIAFVSIASNLFEDEEQKRDTLSIKEKLDAISDFENIFSQPEGIDFLTSKLELSENELFLVKEVFPKLIHWQGTILLPIDEMIITIASQLFSDPADLALAHKIAIILKRSLDFYPDRQLPDFCEELDAILKNRYRLFGFSDEDLGFDPETGKGKVLVSTMHKAKGLEWDRVYLMSVNNYDFPSAEETDSYFSEKWFVKDQRNLEAETLDMLAEVVSPKNSTKPNNLEDATQKARLDYCSERLRLLYVGITRAREDLIFTWNTGRRDNCKEALPLQKMRAYWRENHG